MGKKEIEEGSAADFISNKYVTHQTDSSGSINKHGVSISQEAFVLRLESLCDSRVYGIENAVRDALFSLKITSENMVCLFHM